MESPLIASPRPCETRARISASLKCVVASTIALAIAEGSPGLEDPGADEDAVGAELHAERGVRRSGDAAGREGDDREPSLLR